MCKKVFVQHEPRYDRNNDVIGVYKRRHGHVIQDVTQEYIHRDSFGRHVIRTSSGDTWSVMPVHNDKYQFVTV